jgi:DHA1 family multidrug resistance protein-like MFS transporter
MFGGSVLLLLMAFVQSAEQLVLLRTIQGLITGTVSAASALIAAEAPRKHMGSAMGTLQVGLAGGVAIGPVIGGAIADLYGYRVAFFVTAGLLFISGVAVLFGVKENFSSLANEDFKPRTFIAEWRRVITTPGVLTSYSMRFTSQLGRMMIIPIIPLFISILLVDQSGVNTFTGIVVGVASGTSTISAIYLGRVGDRVGHKKVVIACSLVAALVYIPQSMVTAGWQLLIFQALIGISLGGIIPTISALLARYTQSGEEGAVYGLDNAINAGSRAVAPILGSGVAFLFGMRATFIGTALFFLLVGLLGIWLLPQNT